MNQELKDQFYERVAIEVSENIRHPAPMAKAIEKSAGNADLAKSLYIKFRVEQLARDYKQECRRIRQEARKHQLDAEQKTLDQERRRAIELAKQRQQKIAADEMKPERIQQKLRRKHAIAESKTKLEAFIITILIIFVFLCFAWLL